jgi:hypothetical protein
MKSFKQHITESSTLDENTLSELFDSMYAFKIPSNFKAKEVFYSIPVDDMDIKVQFTSEYADPVLEDNNLIKIAFGRPLKKPKSWIKVDTEELLKLKNPTKLLSTVINGTFTDFITKYFKEDSEKILTLNFHGGLTDDEDDNDVEISNSKRSRIYLAMLKRLPVLKKYKLKVYNLGDDGIEITNDN